MQKGHLERATYQVSEPHAALYRQRLRLDYFPPEIGRVSALPSSNARLLKMTKRSRLLKSQRQKFAPERAMYPAPHRVTNFQFVAIQFFSVHAVFELLRQGVSTGVRDDGNEAKGDV